MKRLVVAASLCLLLPLDGVRLALDPLPVVSCFERGCRDWLDTDSNKIEAHGAGMLQSPTDGRWYWYGESKKTPHLADHGVNCYSSETLAGPWRFEGRVFSQEMMPKVVKGEIGPWVIERPKVLYNNNTSKFVMWFHLDKASWNFFASQGYYSFRHAAVATSPTPVGPFKFVHALQPDGIPSLDMSLWEDVDGQAYFVRSCNNAYMGISRLSPDYLNTTGLLSTGPCVEGMALFRHPNGTLYMISSHLSGWRPNPLVLLRSDGPDLSDPQWTSMGNPTNSSVSFNSQPTFVVPYTQTQTFYDEDGIYHEDKVTHLIYMGDNWVNAGEGLINASYVWLPLRFPGGHAKLDEIWSWSMRDPFVQLRRNRSCQQEDGLYRHS
mmetsp:Transcript_7450/g.17656  ORF Transcript_7450/g.17656 Transcript_7450/m.17656 type:complete len:379 (+) Transcript_7450:25-1161(+)